MQSFFNIVEICFVSYVRYHTISAVMIFCCLAVKITLVKIYFSNFYASCYYLTFKCYQSNKILTGKSLKDIVPYSSGHK
jgi:hypothetical protein